MLLDHNGMKLEINNRKITGRYQNTWKLNNRLLNNTWVEKKSQKKLKLRFIPTTHLKFRFILGQKSLTRFSNSEITENHLWTIPFYLHLGPQGSLYLCLLPSNLWETSYSADLPLLSVRWMLCLRPPTTYAIIVRTNTRMLGPSRLNCLHLIVDLPMWLHSDQSLRRGRWSYLLSTSKLMGLSEKDSEDSWSQRASTLFHSCSQSKKRFYLSIIK